MKLAVTYNAKKENSAPEIPEDASKYLDEELIKNYPERLDDTYAEWDSMDTVEAIRDAFIQYGHTVALVEANEDAYDVLKSLRPDFVFNVAEGESGASRESQIPAMLEMLGIPYTGSDPVTIGICHDKSRCKEILSYYGIPNSAFKIAYSPSDITDDNSYPKFVKPLYEGSSKGIYNSSVAKNLDEVKAEVARINERYNQPALVEEFLTGKEFTVALMGNGDDVKVFPVVEINLDSVPEGFNKIYSYEVKWFFDTRENKLEIFHCPARVSSEMYLQIERVCKDAFKALRIKDWCRIDVRLDKKGLPNIIEVNPLPGILPNPEDNSCYPKAAREAGLDYAAMLNAVLETAVKRYKTSYKAEGQPA